MTNQIQTKLNHIEKEFDVEIILAVESGSRAWGFESVDSDYDVRFIYKHKPEWYIHVLPKRDVIELPVNEIEDYSGWDIKKALFLLNKSNPVLFEWLHSPIVYKTKEPELSELRSATKKYFYALRPILACMWIERNNEPPPIEFDVLMRQIQDETLLQEINSLLARKKAGAELARELFTKKYFGDMEKMPVVIVSGRQPGVTGGTDTLRARVIE